jgi:hypothetical protein
MGENYGKLGQLCRYMEWSGDEGERGSCVGEFVVRGLVVWNDGLSVR